MPRMRIPRALTGAALLAALAFAAILPAAARSTASRKSPHAEIVALARVETAPVRRTHANHRTFEEFKIRILSFTRATEGDAGGDPRLPIYMGGRVQVVHDLSCGGGWVDLKPGDEIEIKGEYVKPEDRGDLIHFTHPADGSCGRAGGHPDGYIRKRR